MRREIGYIMDEFLETKESQAVMDRITSETVKTYRQRLNRIVLFLGPTEKVAKVGYREIGQFLNRTDYSVKSKHDTMTVFKEMMSWARKCKYIKDEPDYPRWRVNVLKDMKLRKTITKEEQARVLADILANEDFKVYVACRLLSTYIHVRPGELLKIKEGDIDREKGTISIRKHKRSRVVPKIIHLLPVDTRILRTCTQPEEDDTPFFRSEAGKKYGASKFLRAWKRACARVGIDGVDLYGGTRHSSVVGLYKESGYSPEEIRAAGGWSSMESYRRYFTMDFDDIGKIHAAASPEVK